MKEITIFRFEVKGVPVVEWTINPTRPKIGTAFKSALLKGEQFLEKTFKEEEVWKYYHAIYCN